MLDRISTYADGNNLLSGTTGVSFLDFYESLLRMVKYVYPKKSSGAGTLFTDSL